MTLEPRTRIDRVLPELFGELADARSPDYLEAAIEHASSRPQRPAWTFPERWLPMEITTRAVSTTAPLPQRQLGVLMIVTILLAATLAVVVGTQQRRLPEPFGPAGNGVIALAKDGDIYVADRPGGELRPLVTGPEDDKGPVFSPDGAKLAFVREDPRLPSALMLADADGTSVVQIATEPPGRLSFAPDGRSLMGVARIGGANRIVLIPVDPGAAPTVLDIRLPRSSMELSWSGGPKFNPTNDQEILVAAQPEPNGPHGLYVYDLATGGIRTIVEPAEHREMDQDGNTVITRSYFRDIAWLPDGEHITYNDRIVAADGSDDQTLDALRMDRLSPFSNDGTRIVVDVAEVDLPGDDSHQRSMVVPVDGEGERVELACGLGMKIECAWSWIWSPDDSMLIGIVPHETSSTYLQADAHTGQVTELDWVDVGTPAWQRVAPPD
jgi:hypothetical protein